MIVFERANLLFIFNFHPTQSFADYRVGTDISGKLKLVLNSDDPGYFGHGRIDAACEYFTTSEPWDNRENWLQVSAADCDIPKKMEHLRHISRSIYLRALPSYWEKQIRLPVHTQLASNAV